MLLRADTSTNSMVPSSESALQSGPTAPLLWVRMDTTDADKAAETHWLAYPSHGYQSE